MQALANAARRYQAVQVTTCSPVQLVSMMYDGIFRFVDEAERALGAGNRAGFGERLGKAFAVVEQLASNLDRSHAPDLAATLEAIYAFVMQRLTEANVHKNPVALEDVRRSLSPLRDAWKTLAAQR